MRCVSTRVFPLPAPARMSSGPSVCSTASSWVGFKDSSNTETKLYQRGALYPVQKYPNLPLSLLHHHALRRDPKPSRFYRLEESGCGGTPGIGEEGLAVRREQLRHEVREGRSVPPLVEHVGGEDEIEGRQVVGGEPVEQRGLRLPADVRAGVVGGEVEGCRVVVGREDPRPAGEGYDRRKPHAATELDGAFSRQLLPRERAGQGHRARPELGPVREPFVVLEVLLVEQVVDGGGVRNAVGSAAHLDAGLRKAGAATQVCPQPIQRDVLSGRRRRLRGRGAPPARRLRARLCCSFRRPLRERREPRPRPCSSRTGGRRRCSTPRPPSSAPGGPRRPGSPRRRGP